MPRFLPIGALVLAAVAFAAPQQRQGATCDLEMVQTPGMKTTYVTLPDGSTRTDVSGGLEATCGTAWMRADSASYYPGLGEVRLFGNVEYTDMGRRLTADRATYYELEEWVRCEGNVHLTDADGRSTLTGPVLDYFPASEIRTQERMYAPSRPHLKFYPSDPAQPEAEPFDVDADRMHIYGDTVVACGGEVVAVRGDMVATSDTMHLDLANDELWLLADPEVTANDMLLVGDSILVRMEDSEVREIEAWPNGSAQGSDMELAAPALRFFVQEGEIGRAVASAGDPARTGVLDSVGRLPWALSTSEDYILTADSLDILRPGGRLEQVVAIDRARARSVRPSVPGDELLGYDWLQGDTITGFFAPPTDTVVTADGQPELNRLVASGNARALYHLQQQTGEGETEPSEEEGTNHRTPNYVIGRIVTLWLVKGEVSLAEVIGPAIGVYLEPLPQVPDTAAADTTLAAPDSLKRAAEDTVPAAHGKGGRE